MTAFRFANRVHRAEYDETFYLERTARNQFWLGGRDGQLAVRELKVGVAGLGGMGSNIANALARLGVGHIRIADPDTIDASNINRQVIAYADTVGKTKSAACFDELRRIAPDFDIVAYDQGITEETVEEFVDGCDVIVDEIDVFPLDKHVLLHDAANQRGLPIYSAYVVGLGVHIYKYQGTEYTIHDFLGDESQWRQPTPEYLIERFGTPLPDYLDADTLADFGVAMQSGIPIFGTSCLLAHSFVATKVVIDYLHDKLGAERLPWMRDIAPTPRMPKLTIIDPIDLRMFAHDMSKPSDASR